MLKSLGRSLSLEKRVRKDKDYYTWAMQTAESLRDIGLVEIAEDLEEMARSEVRELRHRLVILHQHRLKWIHQPELRSNSWVNSVTNAQDQVKILLRENPGLKNSQLLNKVHDDAYRIARRKASTDTGFSVSKFPVSRPSHEVAMGHLNPPLRRNRGTLGV
jgi:hypothetical protein